MIAAMDMGRDRPFDTDGGLPNTSAPATSLRAKLACDIRINLKKADRIDGVRGQGNTIALLMTARFVSVALFRLASQVGPRSRMLAGLIKQLNQFLTGADLAWQAQIGPGLVLFHPQGVVIGPYVRVGSECTIQQGVTLGGSGNAGENRDKSPTVGNGVTIGAGAKIFGQITLGDGCVIGANAVVIVSVPDEAIAVGVPARTIFPKR